jgi:parvulin-like peptidyl-prolyl isomerase
VTLRSLRLRALSLALVAAAVLAACGGGQAPAAEVDGEQTTDAELARDMDLFTFLSALNQSTCGTPVEGETQEAACARFTLTNVIQEDLVKHYAAANDLTVDETDVKATVTQLETNLGVEGLAAQLKEAGLVRADVEELARRLLLFGRVQTSMAEGSVTDEQVKAAYQERIGEFTDVEIAHILVQTEAEAKKIAEQATPKNFASLAAKDSIDTGSGANGGSLGVLSEASYLQGYDPTFMEAAFALDVGGISEPVQTQFGWHVIYLKERQARPLADVADQIRQELSGQAFDQWMREQLSSADITVNPKYGKFDPATGQVTAIRSTDSTGPFVSPSATASATP